MQMNGPGSDNGRKTACFPPCMPSLRQTLPASQEQAVQTPLRCVAGTDSPANNTSNGGLHLVWQRKFGITHTPPKPCSNIAAVTRTGSIEESRSAMVAWA